MKNLKTTLLWAVGLVMAAIAVWQFYRFANFKDLQGVVDLQGGTLHLWLAMGAAVVACACAFLGIFRRINQPEEIHITSS